jgi:hypothetical protein
MLVLGGFAETSPNFHQTTQCHIPEGNYGQNPPEVTLELRVATKNPLRKTGVRLLNIINKLYSLSAQAANGVAGRGFVKKISEK